MFNFGCSNHAARCGQPARVLAETSWPTFPTGGHGWPIALGGIALAPAPEPSSGLINRSCRELDNAMSRSRLPCKLGIDPARSCEQIARWV